MIINDFSERIVLKKAIFFILSRIKILFFPFFSPKSNFIIRRYQFSLLETNYKKSTYNINSMLDFIRSLAYSDKIFDNPVLGKVSCGAFSDSLK